MTYVLKREGGKEIYYILEVSLERESKLNKTRKKKTKRKEKWIKKLT